MHLSERLILVAALARLAVADSVCASPTSTRFVTVTQYSTPTAIIESPSTSAAITESSSASAAITESSSTSAAVTESSCSTSAASTESSSTSVAITESSSTPTVTIEPSSTSETATPSPSTCASPPKRLEWRQLTTEEKKSYIEAVQCLTTKDAISGIEGAINRFDDHQAVHSSQTPDIHWVGHFILWHRYFVATYEKALREECGWTLGQPYWDWSQDADPSNPDSTAAFQTEIFDPVTGFGGNGPFIEPTPEQNPLNITGGTGGGCVQDGPFTEDKFTVNYPTPDCLRRDFIPWIMNTFADPALVEEVLSQPDYTSFAKQIENLPSFDQPNIHGSGHFGVGGVLGTIGNAANSPGDPLFFLHHGNLDHVLWQWQQKDLETRLSQVGGPIIPFDYSGTNVTLDFTINMGALDGDATLKDILNTEGGCCGGEGHLCYTY